MGAGGMDNETAAKLRHIIGRVERIEEQVSGLNEDKSEVYQEAKSFGLEIKAVKALVAKRRKVAKDPSAFTELETVVELYEAALESRPARMQVRARAETSESSQEEFDEETGEITEPVEVRAQQGIANADTPAVEVAHEAAGAPLYSSEEPAPQSNGAVLDALIERARTHVMTDGEREAQARSFAYGNAAIDNPDVTREMVAAAPCRVTDPAPEPAAPDPDASPLIADAAARMEAARKLLGQAGAGAE